MKTHRRFAAAALSVAMLAATGFASAQRYYEQGYQGPPPQAWETAPPQFAAAAQRGYNDGVKGARLDFDNHRPPNVENRDEYRNPHFIAPPDRNDYRMGFREGYRAAVAHIYGRR